MSDDLKHEFDLEKLSLDERRLLRGRGLRSASGRDFNVVGCIVFLLVDIGLFIFAVWCVLEVLDR